MTDNNASATAAAASRLKALSQAMTDYGETSVRLRGEIHEIGDAIAKALPAFLGTEVFAVRPAGDWEPKPYNHAAFSDFGGGLLQVGPIDMGVAVLVPHLRDNGKTWVRIVIGFTPAGGSFKVGPVDGANVDLSCPATSSDISRVCELIVEHLIGFFSDPARKATTGGSSSVGFLAGGRGG